MTSLTAESANMTVSGNAKEFLRLVESIVIVATLVKKEPATDSKQLNSQMN